MHLVTNFTVRNSLIVSLCHFSHILTMNFVSFFAPAKTNHCKDAPKKGNHQVLYAIKVLKQIMFAVGITKVFIMNIVYG